MPRRRFYPNLVIIQLLDAALIAVSFYIAHLFRFEFDIDADFRDRMINLLPVVILTKAALFHFFDLYRGMWRYTSINDLLNIIKAAVTSSLVLISGVLLITHFQGFSRSVFLIDACFVRHLDKTCLPASLPVLVVAGCRIAGVAADRIRRSNAA